MAEMVQQVRQHQPDLVFADIRMPKLDGLQAIRAARQASPHAQWVILTGYPEFQYAQDAFNLCLAVVISRQSPSGALELGLYSCDGRFRLSNPRG